MSYLPTIKIFAIAATAFLFLTGCDRVFSQSRGVCITGYNEYDRGIYEFWLDNEGKSGCFGNPSGRSPGYDFGGGGGFACGCKLTPGSTVNLYWRFERTREEYDRKISPEEHTVAVTIPELDVRSPRYFRVYFMRDGTTKLQWAEAMTPELASNQVKEVGK
jgi:hypothetical protein